MTITGATAGRLRVAVLAAVSAAWRRPACSAGEGSMSRCSSRPPHSAKSAPDWSSSQTACGNSNVWVWVKRWRLSVQRLVPVPVPAGRTALSSRPW